MPRDLLPQRTVLRIAIGIGLTIFAWSSRLSADEQPVKKLILPGESFSVEGRPAFVLLPPEEKRQTPQPWIMYAPTLPAYPDSHEKWMHEQFLAAGFVMSARPRGSNATPPSPTRPCAA